MQEGFNGFIERTGDPLQLQLVKAALNLLERCVPSWRGPQELTTISRAGLIVVGCNIMCQLSLAVH